MPNFSGSLSLNPGLVCSTEVVPRTVPERPSIRSWCCFCTLAADVAKPGQIWAANLLNRKWAASNDWIFQLPVEPYWCMIKYRKDTMLLPARSSLEQCSLMHKTIAPSVSLFWAHPAISRIAWKLGKGMYVMSIHGHLMHMKETVWHPTTFARLWSWRLK